MSRIRTIKPSFFLDEGLAKLPALDRIVFAGLWTQADKAGLMEDRPPRLRVQILPYDDGNFDAILQRLHDAGFIHRYAVNGVNLLRVNNFSKHQRPHHTEPDSTLPPPPPGGNGVNTVKAPLLDGESPLRDGEAPEGREGKGREGKGRERERASRVRFAPPSLVEVAEYGKEIPGLNAEAFCDFYASKGWKVGSQPMKDWKAAARNWRRRDRANDSGAPRVVVHKNQADLDREREGDEIARNRAAATREREEREARENHWERPDTPEERTESERLCNIREAQLLAAKAKP